MIDGRNDNFVEVVVVDAADKEDFEVVFDGGDLGVVDAGLPVQLLGLLMQVDADRGEPQLRLTVNHPGPLPGLVHNSMLQRFDTFLGACLMFVRQDGPGRSRQ